MEKRCSLWADIRQKREICMGKVRDDWGKNRGNGIVQGLRGEDKGIGKIGN